MFTPGPGWFDDSGAGAFNRTTSAMKSSVESYVVT
jgi:hypothetical protein